MNKNMMTRVFARGMAGVALAVMSGTSVQAALMSPVKTGAGLVSGVSNSGLTVFMGIPFAKPPVGELRWKAPQPAAPWTGVRKADKFGARCLQDLVFADVLSRADQTSEDCLYLNVWTTAESSREPQPVLVYFYGGGFMVGDGSEPRYDGANIARQGVVVVTLNYRLGVFGFLAHPELSKETTYGGSGNYGLLDQVAALRWVRDNIAAFGGDPRHITIGGESAGSISVSAQMASPLSRDLIAGAIGESGSMLGALSALPLAKAESVGQEFVTHAGVASLAALRALSAERVLAAARTFRQSFSPSVDGYFLPKPLYEIYSAGEQAKVPLLAGSNSQEGSHAAVLGTEAPTVQGFRNAVTKLYGSNAEAVLKAYPATTDGDVVLDAAQQLASDRFIAQSTWRWVDVAATTGKQPTFYYYYSRKRPDFTPAAATMIAERTAKAVRQFPPSPPPRGAVHASEIEYALGNLDVNPLYQWQAEDHQISRLVNGYFVNFIKTGNPNGAGLPHWPSYDTGLRMRLDVNAHEEQDQAATRGRMMDAAIPRDF